MRKPRALKPGDRVAVVAPASGCPGDELERGIAELRRLGFDAAYSPVVAARGLFSAGSPAERARDFQTAWTDPSVSALVALRGGYGSAQLLPLLDAGAIAASPKLFVGYSDTTAILTWLTCHAGVTALHGPMVDRRLSRGPAGYDEASFVRLLQGDVPLDLPCPDGVVLHEGEAAGPLFGGTLTQLTASLGTPWAFVPPDGSVLFLEDVNERPYRIHRMLTQLVQAGLVSRARAIVLGQMPGCDEPGHGGPTALDAARDALEGFGGPVFAGFPSGHTTGACVSLPFGTTVRVHAQGPPSLRVEESPVA
jgi:muramoyltetrapeptide carboxypeptidase